MSAPLVVSAPAGLMILLITSSLSNPLLAVVPVGMWAQASISPPSELAREAGKRSRSAKPIVHISTGLPRKFAAACGSRGSDAVAPSCRSVAKRRPGLGLGDAGISVQVYLLVFNTAPQP